MKRTAVVVALAAGLPTFAAGLSPGTDEPRTTSIVSDGTFTISGEASGLFPGGSVPLVTSIANPQPSAIAVRTMDVAVGDASPACTAANVLAERFSGVLEVAGHGRADLTTDVRMLHSAPDGCQDATFPLTFTGTATLADVRGLELTVDQLTVDGYVNLAETQDGREMVTRVVLHLHPGDSVSLDVTIVDRNGRRIVPAPIRISSPGASGWTASDVRSLADGPITITARGVSTQGYRYEATIEPTLDLHAPVVSIAPPPSPGIMIGLPSKAGLGGATLRGSSADALEVARVEVSYAPRLAVAIGNAGPSEARLDGPATRPAWTSATYPGPGWWDVRARATDRAGNVSAPAALAVLIV